jgi:hypothetical protein
MRIAYLLTIEDYVQYNLFLQKRRMERFRMSRWYLPAFVLKWLALSVFAFGFAFGAWYVLLLWILDPVPPSNRITAGLAAITAVLALGVFAGAQRPLPKNQALLKQRAVQRQVHRAARKGLLYVDYSCELVLSAAETVLTVQREWAENGASCAFHSQYRVPWVEVQRIEQFHRHAFILTNSSAAIFIPQRSFADLGEFQAFVDEARRCWAGVTATAITATGPAASPPSAIAVKPLP